MSINKKIILGMSVSVFAFCASKAFCDVLPPPPAPPILINLDPNATPPNPDQAAIDAAAKAAAEAAAQAAALAAASQTQQAGVVSTGDNQPGIDAAALAAQQAAAEAAERAAQQAVNDAIAAVSAAQTALTGMTTDAATVKVLKQAADAAVNQSLAKIQSDAATTVAKKVTDAVDVIQNSLNTVNASASSAPGNADVAKAVSDITQIKTNSDGIVADVNNEVAAALAVVSTKPVQ